MNEKLLNIRLLALTFYLMGTFLKEIYTRPNLSLLSQIEGLNQDIAKFMQEETSGNCYLLVDYIMRLSSEEQTYYATRASYNSNLNTCFLLPESNQDTLNERKAYQVINKNITSSLGLLSRQYRASLAAFKSIDILFKEDEDLLSLDKLVKHFISSQASINLCFSKNFLQINKLILSRRGILYSNLTDLDLICSKDNKNYNNDIYYYVDCKITKNQARNLTLVYNQITPCIMKLQNEFLTTMYKLRIINSMIGKCKDVSTSSNIISTSIDISDSKEKTFILKSLSRVKDCDNKIKMNIERNLVEKNTFNSINNDFLQEKLFQTKIIDT